MTSAIIAMILGVMFGASLVLSGLTDPDKIIGSLRLKDFHALRTVAVFILVAMLGTWLLGLEGAANLNIRPAAIVTILIGGALLGCGLGLTGFGPATGLASAASGRIDALATVVGMFIGAHVYVLIYPSLAMRLEGLLNFGKVTLPQITGTTAASWVIPIVAAGLVTLLLTLPRKPREARSHAKATDRRLDLADPAPAGLLLATGTVRAAKMFRRWANCLFLIVVLCIFVLQTSFWLTKTGYIEIDRAIIADASSNFDNKTQDDQALRPVTTEAPMTTPHRPGPFAFDITFHRLSVLVGIANTILVFASVLYCLTMLCGLIVSLDGNLGLIKHIGRAFYLSVVVLLLLLPWQIPFGPTAFGAIYTLRELINACTRDMSGVLDVALINLRFAGWWALVALLLAMAQWHSFRWTGSALAGRRRAAQGQSTSQGRSVFSFLSRLRKGAKWVGANVKFQFKSR